MDNAYILISYQGYNVMAFPPTLQMQINKGLECTKALVPVRKMD